MYFCLFVCSLFMPNKIIHANWFVSRIHLFDWLIPLAVGNPLTRASYIYNFFVC